MTRKKYMSLNVEGFLRNTKYPRDFIGVFNEDNGDSMSPETAHKMLMAEIRKGHHVIPCSPECGNPCKHKGCAGFDYGEKGGCPGYEIAAVVGAGSVT